MIKQGQIRIARSIRYGRYFILLAVPWKVMAVGLGGGFLIVDRGNSRIRLVQDGIIFTVVGNGIQGFVWMARVLAGPV